MLEVAIVGASGYGGGELLRLLHRHPNAEVKCAISETYAGQPITNAFPGMARQSNLRFQSYGDGSEVAQCDIVFLAQENRKAMHTAPHLLEAGCKVIDLSADFRFRDASVYETWYKVAHACPQWNDRAVYGLPELFRDQIKRAQIVGNPGCNATASILALAPLVANRLVDERSIVVDVKTGVSGAGRAKFGLEYHFAEMNESVSAYKVAGTHRHTPEIEAALQAVAGHEIALSFTPHLIAMTRGILASCYANLNNVYSATDLYKIYAEFYANTPFIVLLEDGLPATKHTVGSNRCHIGLAVDSRLNRVSVFSALDNLMKGAASQAIQNMNLMCGLDETAGLDDIGGLWP